MVCNKCKNDGILNQANGKKFYYCRTCKDEIYPEEVKAPSAIAARLLAEEAAALRKYLNSKTYNPNVDPLCFDPNCPICLKKP